MRPWNHSRVALFHDFPSSFYVLEFRARRSTEFQHQPPTHTHTTRDINDIWFPFCKLHTAPLCNCWLRNFGGRLNFLESSIGKISKLEEQSWHFWRSLKFFHPRRKWKNHFDKIRVLNSSPNEVVIKRSVHYAKVTFLISFFVPRSYSERNLFGFTARHFILLYLA